jgi:hypothetical protein
MQPAVLPAVSTEGPSDRRLGRDLIQAAGSAMRQLSRMNPKGAAKPRKSTAARRDTGAKYQNT